TGPGPTAEFMFGSQFDIRKRAIENGWITRSSYLTEPYTSNRNETFTASVQVEPMPSLRVDFSANRNYSRNMFQSGFNTQIDDNTFGYE
ncbi:hypothetical protein, partial [Klebsiella pneumoniae]